jgi:hypothetical protein
MKSINQQLLPRTRFAGLLVNLSRLYSRLERDTRISWPNGLLRGGRYRIKFALTLLDPTPADMALYRDADMVRAIAGTCSV